MKTSRNVWFGGMLVAACVAWGIPSWGQGGVKDTTAERGDAVAELATAAQLAAFGKGELNASAGLGKNFRSPEALVAAGGILLRVHKASGGELNVLDAEVTDEEGKKVADDTKPTTLDKEAQELFDAAVEAASTDKDKGKVAAINAMVKELKEAVSKESRGAVGGPRVISKKINSGKTHSFKIPFEANSHATVTMRGTGTTQFEVLGAGGNVLWHSKGAWGVYSWNTGGGAGRGITVKVINGKGPAVHYTVTTN